VKATDSTEALHDQREQALQGGDSSRVAPRRIARFLLHRLVDFHFLAVAIFATLRGRCKPLVAGRGRTVLLTGTFYSENWILNHLRPLAKCESTRVIWIVCSFPIPGIDKVVWVKPPRLLAWMGETPARLLCFLGLAVRHRPDYVGGFHLLINGLQSLVISKLMRSRSLYINGGGAREVLGGGYLGNRLFGKLGGGDAALEKKLLKAVGKFDLVITMGPAVIDYFRDKGVCTRFEVVPGGIDRLSLERPTAKKEYDFILVGMLGQVKRVDIFLEAIKIVADEVPTVSAVVVGAGELEADLKRQASDLGLDGIVTFAGFQEDVPSWLQRSRLFVLTSDSEGLSLALMEAMTCGLPAIVSDVGELSDIVVDGVNGFLVDSRAPSAFAKKMRRFLGGCEILEEFSAAASEAAAKFELGQTKKRWEAIFASDGGSE
jgi:glycosyltransferase involved in cell wall biosynthesis